MKNPSTALRLLLAACLGAAVAARAADDNATATAKLSAPNKPSILRIDMPWAEIRITGENTDSVTVESSIAHKDNKPTRPGGLRRLDDDVSFDLNEKDNVVTLRLAGDNPWASHDAQFRITVPRAMSLDVRTDVGGDLQVDELDGDIEIHNMNGSVHLKDIVGSAVISTMNGEVHARYAKPPQKLVSITSMNGEVDLQVPSESKATVRLRTQNGSILTDFGEDVLKTKSEGHSKGYAYAYHDGLSAKAAADAARQAARTAVHIANEVAVEVRQAFKDEDDDDDDDDTPPTPPAAPAPAAPAAAPEAPAPAVAPTAPVSADAKPAKNKNRNHNHGPRPPIPPITGGKLVSGTLNGGGVDINISTMNGEIKLRQAQ